LTKLGHCGQATVPADLGRCHDLGGLYSCDPAADYPQTVAMIAAPNN
jgi:hypothetical protein